MNPEQIILIETGVIVLFGVFATLFGLRLVGRTPKKNPAPDAQFSRYGRWVFLVCGPALIIVSLSRAVIHLSK